MRLIVMTNRFGDVGTHPQLTRLALHMKAIGHDVRAVTLGQPGTIADMFAEAGIDMDMIDASRRGSLVPVVIKLAAVFRRWRPDAVVAFLYGAIVPARLASRLAGVPIVISSIRNEHFGPRHRELILRATERLSTATVVNSRTVADSLTRRGIASRRHLVVIPNGIDSSAYLPPKGARQHVRASMRLDDREFVWLSIGRLTHQKDYPGLFQAFSHVLRSSRESRLLIVGRGSLQQELEDLARRAGLEDRVSFLGFRSDIPSLLAASDAFVMASRWEGLPNAVMEALAAGIPVVGTAVGGMGELVHEGANGYLVQPSEPDTLAVAMAKMMETPEEERARMGRTGQALVRRNFEQGAVMDAWSRLIGDAVRSGAGR